ncbi:hypothetical protein [Brevibacillus porteri]|uniref:Fur-regulated basic protein FbpA n=1 Tax=Brevibacillus porteri TaxID=2126350 RepID=A0ABX5FJH5_9BACL|nr:hypothetical protein [Brevibacillus porteri]MED1802994.1 hypothetical protein [Brevibacillus porteri]MED2134646.1 hypothetical protein [Brevibacillus porteri]MED2748175.1 hypothetical protein [Brevibacillus porteri]MED2817498.1 hypothetical protein [Brevibacillus porteri]MED2897806.1 hypothetical protein [Brevibacillus porteri]
MNRWVENQKRVKELERLGVPLNHIVKAAIKELRNAEYIDVDRVRCEYHLSEGDAIVAEIEKLMKSRGRRL